MIEDFVDTLIGLSDVDAIWQATEDLSCNVGFSRSLLVRGQKGPAGTIHAPRIMIDCPEEWITAYTENEGLGEIDPFLLFACKSPAAIKLTTKDLSSFPKASRQHQLFLDFMEAAGTKNAIGVPVRTDDHDVFGGWIFSSDASDRHFDLLANEHGQGIHLAGILAYERMVALGLGSVTDVDLLSARERECLLWLCAGLRVTEIGDKLSIRDSAVSLYITNAKRKLGSKTREQAVARAIFSGQIQL